MRMPSSSQVRAHERRVMSLLAADRGLGLRAAIAFAPGAMAWNDPGIQPLLTGRQQDKVPTFIVQAANDFNLGPVQTLDLIVVRNGVKPHRAKLYRPMARPPWRATGHSALQGSRSAIRMCWRSSTNPSVSNLRRRGTGFLHGHGLPTADGFE
jgi:hypothetical protein